MGGPQTVTPTRLGEKQPTRNPRGHIRASPSAARDREQRSTTIAPTRASRPAGTTTARPVTGNTKGGGYHAATNPNRQGRNTQQKPRRHTQHPHQGGWVSVCGAFVADTRAKTRQKLWQR